jgi:hypothetical protein
MTRTLRALIWLRWRLLLGTIRGWRRRDALEQISRGLALIIPFVFIALSVGSVVAVSVLGVIGGRALATGLAQPGLVVAILRLVLAGVLLLAFVVSLVAPAQTTLTLYKRLLVLPVPRSALHVMELLAGVVDPWVGPLVPGLLFFAAGLASGGALAAGAVALGGAVAILALLVLVGSLVSSLVGWLLGSRRRGEIFTLVLVIALSLVSFIPPVLSRNLDARRRAEQQAGEPAQDFSIDRLDAALPRWTRALPSELYGHALRSAIDGRLAVAWRSLGLLAVEGLVLFAASAAAHRHLLDALETDHEIRRTVEANVRLPRVPLMSPAASAVALAEVRTAFRSVRGRLVVLLPGPIVALMVMLVRGMPDDRLQQLFTGIDGYVLLGAGLIFSLFALQPFTMNLFGADRAGLTLQFLAPMTGADIARGKIAGCAVVFGGAAAFCVMSMLAVARTGSPLDWIAALAGGAATYLLIGPVAVWLSALFPVASDLSKTGAGGNAHPVPTLAGTVIVLVLAAPAVAILVGVSSWGGRHLLGLFLMIVWAAIAGAIAWPLIGVAGRAVDARRENLALVAQGR